MSDFKDDERNACEAHPEMGDYATFEEIPKDQISEPGLMAWVALGGLFEQIPEPLRTEPVLWVAVRHDKDAYALIKPEDVTDHRKLSLEAVKHKMTIFDCVPYQDEQFLIDMAMIDIRLIIGIRLEAEFPHLITERLAEGICSQSIHCAYEFTIAGGAKAEQLLKDEYIEVAIKASTTEYPLLRHIKKEAVLMRLLGDGFWPKAENFSKTPSFSTTPANPAEAFDRLINTTAVSFQMLHRCWLKAQPVSEVVAGLQGTQKGLDELFNLYSVNELRSHMKEFRSIRGRLIEHDLGM